MSRKHKDSSKESLVDSIANPSNISDSNDECCELESPSQSSYEESPLLKTSWTEWGFMQSTCHLKVSQHCVPLTSVVSAVQF